MSYRPLTISAPVYRGYATMRLRHLEDWIRQWALPEMYAGIPEVGAVDAWMKLTMELESLKLEGKHYCGGAADIAKFFDQVRREMVYKIAKAAGMPQPVITAYSSYLEALMVYNCLAGGVGTPFFRICGIPQGCPFSMAIVALIMRPWILLMRTFLGIQCYILADDVLILATGRKMVFNFAAALNTTHTFLHKMGARVAPDKSHNFASHPKAKAWLQEVEWEGVGQKIDVETDFRYLGAHVTTRSRITSTTLDDRFGKAIAQLKRLRYCPAGVDAKIKVIHAKVYAGALYGVEAAQVTPSKLAKLSAAVIDAFRSRNDNHNADRFYATTTIATKDLDPVIQVFSRRAMQIRRTAYKQPHAKEQIKEILQKYVAKHRRGEQKPKWYHGPANSGTESEAFQFPIEQPHPSTKEHAGDWDADINAQGPVGLLVESILWHGMAIDDDFNIWQKGEPPIDLFNVPYQNLKLLIMEAAARARTRAEWLRDTGNVESKEIREIDRDLSQVDKELTEEEKGVVRTALMGGNQAKCEIAKYNEDIDKTCNYCKEADSTTGHVRWVCSYFKQSRQDLDPDLAEIPVEYLPLNVRTGIAPAMKVEGNATYWGRILPDTLSTKIRKMMGEDRELSTPGDDGDKSHERQEALNIAQDLRKQRAQCKAADPQIQRCPCNWRKLDIPSQRGDRTSHE